MGSRSPLLSLVALAVVVPTYADTVGTKSKPQSPAQSHFQEGISNLNKGDLPKAELAFRRSLAANHAFIPALVGMADVLVRLGRTDEAASHLKQALKMAPKDAAVQRSWARYLVGQGKVAEAEAALRAATQLKPDLETQLELGDLYLLSRKPDQAAQAFRSALAIDKSHARARQGLGTAMALMGDTAKAEAELNEAVRLAVADPRPLYALAMFYYEQKQPGKAVETFSKCLQVQPKFVPAIVALGDIHASKNETAKAIEQYSAAVQIEPRSAEIHVRLGVLQQMVNQPEKAEQAYRAAIQADASFALAYNNLAFLAAQRKTTLDEALAWARKAVALGPQVPQFQDTLGWVLRARGDLDGALSVLEKASTLQPPLADLFYHLGVVYAEKGRKQETVASLRKALALSQNFLGADDARERLKTLTGSKL